MLCYGCAQTNVCIDDLQKWAAKCTNPKYRSLPLWYSVYSLLIFFANLCSPVSSPVSGVSNTSPRGLVFCKLLIFSGPTHFNQSVKLPAVDSYFLQGFNYLIQVGLNRDVSKSCRTGAWHLWSIWCSITCVQSFMLQIPWFCSINVWQ